MNYRCWRLMLLALFVTTLCFPRVDQTNNQYSKLLEHRAEQQKLHQQELERIELITRSIQSPEVNVRAQSPALTVNTRIPDPMATIVTYGDGIIIQDQAGLGHLYTTTDIQYTHTGTMGGNIVGITAPTNGAYNVLDHIWYLRGPSGTGPSYKLGEPIKRGDVIRFQHARTGNYLFADNHVAPLNLVADEVSSITSGSLPDVNWVLQDTTLALDGQITIGKTGMVFLHLVSDQLLASAQRGDPAMGNRYPIGIRPVSVARRKRDMGIAFFVVRKATSFELAQL